VVQVRFLHVLLLHSGNNDNDDNNTIKDQQLPLLLSLPLLCPPSGNVHKVLLIHSVNPYGMCHHWQTNKNNVDLNCIVLGGPAFAKA
jgi:hypothetical protein